MTVIERTARRAFSSLRLRNFRLFFFGQMISVSGIWMQRVAQAWLVLDLTGSGTAIGLVTACQFLPMLFLAPMGGLIADRFDKRRLLLLTQGTAGILALALGLLVSFDLIRLWMVYLLAGMVGLAYAVDTPARQSFVLEMVGPDEVTNAVTLNSVLVNMSRVIGPSLAGVLIVTTGLGVCFLVNAGSYLAILAALALMRTGDLQRTPPEGKRRGQVREGLLYVWSTPALLVPLLMMAAIGTLAYEFQVTLPLVAKFTFGGDARTYGLLTALMGSGAVVGGLLTASRRVRRPTALARAALAFGVVQVGAAMAPALWAEYAVMVLLGAASISFLALGNATLQLGSAPGMRGRVMALWAVAFLGSTPIGGPLVGWIGEHVGPRYGLGIGGVAAVLAGALAYRKLATLGARSDRGLAPAVSTPIGLPPPRVR